MAKTKKQMEADYFGDVCALEWCAKPWTAHTDKEFVEHRQGAAILVYPAPPLATLLGADMRRLSEWTDPPSPRARPIEEWPDDELELRLGEDPANETLTAEHERRHPPTRRAAKGTAKPT